MSTVLCFQKVSAMVAFIAISTAGLAATVPAQKRQFHCNQSALERPGTFVSCVLTATDQTGNPRDILFGSFTIYDMDDEILADFEDSASGAGINVWKGDGSGPLTVSIYPPNPSCGVAFQKIWPTTPATITAAFGTDCGGVSFEAFCGTGC